MLRSFVWGEVSFAARTLLIRVIPGIVPLGSDKSKAQ